jgi:integrase
MRGHLRQRYDGTWNIVLDMGRRLDPKTGMFRRIQKWYTVKGTKKQAQKKLTDLLHKADNGQVIEPSKMTLGEWLQEWLEAAIKPKRLRSYETYKSVIKNHLNPKLGQFRLCELRATHLQQYYNEAKLSPSTLEQHHAILHSALKAAERQDLVPRNVASLVVGKPRAAENQENVLQHCWEPEEAHKFLEKAKAAGTQPAAFYTLALETGMRKAELCGLKWSDLDLEAATLAVVRQLVKPGHEPIFGPPKNGQARTVYLSPQVLALLRKHKATQATLKLQYGTAYQDHGLVFAKEGPEFGPPLQINNLGQREYRKLITAAGVRAIKFHGLRHTCATLLLKAGVPVKVVSERLGHKKIEMTLNIYAHALPSMQQDAAAKLADVLHG